MRAAELEFSLLKFEGILKIHKYRLRYDVSYIKVIILKKVEVYTIKGWLKKYI